MTSHISMDAADAPTQVREAGIKTILPLALLTCNSILAMDLYLPAVPTLQRDLGSDVQLAQGTIAVYFLGLAVSQLFWGELVNKFGPRKCIQLGIAGLLVCSLGCAFAGNINLLLLWRAVQGFFAGAATVISPIIIKATLEEKAAIKGIGVIAGIEALMPILGPLLGAQLLQLWSWRSVFAVLAAASILVLPVVGRIAPRTLRIQQYATSGLPLYKDMRYIKLALSHALAMGALLTFIASAPQLVEKSLGLGKSYFLLLQVIGVASFIVTISVCGVISSRLGVARTVQFGAFLQFSAAIVALLALQVINFGFMQVALFWAAFGCAMAIRGPAAYIDALSVSAANLGRASAVLVLALLCFGAIGTALVAPYLNGEAVGPLVTVMLSMLTISALLVVKYPSPVSVLENDCHAC